MIELINADTCTSCGRCVEVCPTDVFDPVPGAPPAIARQSECTSCMNCELYCPHDSIYVSPLREPEADLDPVAIIASGVLGSYARAMNWENGQAPSGTGDNWALQLRERQGEKPPPEGDKIRTLLYSVRDRNLI
jgi:NAD-dependent dihydropyrimidine dehydrogenase PreA subunit